jgi:superfamily II DNA or RNA helicase
MRVVPARKPSAPQEPETSTGVVRPIRELREYQVKAVNHWVEHGYNSIFEMATGTGKTFTAINALKKFRENNSYLRAVVVVPLTTLTVQWQDDIKKILPDINIINTSVSTKWKDELNNIIFSKELGRDLDYILVTTYSMFSKEDFGERLGRLGDDLILLADEMHNLVNTNRIKALANPAYRYKLGLSATPTRLWQPTESAIAKLHFGGNSYQYSLADAITNGFLVPYNYHPLPTYLTAEEYEEYLELSKDIARMSQVKTSENEGNSALHMKLIARSRIKKNAESKIFSLEKTLRNIQKEDGLQNALIYVDNEEYLQGLQEMLTRNNIRTTKFVGNNSLEERLSAIQNLRTQSINAIVAIKCLDEGVDIPSAKTAFFISNNTDPREYVQRLGRVLRLDEEGGKEVSEIYDYIVMPPQDVVYENDMDRRIARNMIKNELIRARFFNELALNSSAAKEIIDDAVDRYGFYYEDDELTYSIGDEDNELTY